MGEGSHFTEGSFVLGHFYTSYAGTIREGEGRASDGKKWDASEHLWAKRSRVNQLCMWRWTLSGWMCGCVIVVAQSCVVNWWLMFDWGHMHIYTLKLLWEFLHVSTEEKWDMLTQLLVSCLTLLVPDLYLSYVVRYLVKSLWHVLSRETTGTN